MNSIKRQLFLDELANKSIKKLRISLATYYKDSLSITRIENLSNELFYEIFDYLDGYDIDVAFSNLNIRFQHLINCSLLPLKINVCSKSKTSIEHLCRKVIIPNRDRIRALHLKNKLFIDEFLTECVIDSSFNRLESIVFNEITNNKLQTLLLYLQTLPRLLILTIYLKKDDSYDFDDIYQMIFRFLILKYNKLSLLDNTISRSIVPSLINRQFSTIECLVIDYNCSLYQILSLLQYTPQLCRLQCKRLKHLHGNMDSKDKLMLSRLTYICIENCCLTFDKFETFIRKISSPVEVLRITTYWDMAYLDAGRWEQLILQHIPHLGRFDFNHHHQLLYNNYEYTHFGLIINRFTLPFWIERQWIFELKITRTVFICTIHSRRTWLHSHKYTEVITLFNQNTNDNSVQTIQSSSAIQLTIADSCTATWYHSVIDKINPIFIAVRFTHLHINCNEMFIGTFIKLVQLLPNLVFLKLSSFPFLQLSCLSSEDMQNLILISANNKISKVSFEGMNDFEQVYFVIFLCSRIQYLEVRCTKYTNIDILLRYILMKRYTHTPHLGSLHFYIPNANQDLVHKLQKLIYLEKLLNCYTIKRFGDNIHLRWK